MRFVDAVWRFFCSLQLTALLIAVLMAGAFVGMFVDQTLTYEEHMARLGAAPLQARLFTSLELYDLFGSWWFMGLTLLLALNLIACTLNRLPGVWRQVFYFDPDLDDTRLRGLRHAIELPLPRADPGLELGRQALARLTGRLVEKPRPDGVLLFGEKQRLVRFAVVVVHTSLLLILGGHVANTSLGTGGSLSIVEQTSSGALFVRGPAGLHKREVLPFELRCDDFRVETFVSGQPKDYESDLVVLDGGQERLRKTIRVNDPLTYGGFTFYQSSYRQLPGDERVDLQVGPRGGPLRAVRAAIGERVALDDGSVLVPVETVPNLGGMGEALRVNRIAPGGATESMVLFKRFPNAEAAARQGGPELRYLGADLRYATILSVGRAPFAWLVFLGFALLILGTLAGLLSSHRRYWVRLWRDPDGRGRLLFAGTAKKHGQAFGLEFERLASELRARLEGRAGGAGS